MMRRTFCLGVGAAIFSYAIALAQEDIFGRALMTEAEIAEQQRLMRGAATDAERERIRLENHERMTARARERGVTLPDEPPMGGMGQDQDAGPGPRQGGGQGQGVGKGQGQRQGSAMGQGGGQGQGGGAGQPLIRKGQGAGN